MAYPVKFKEDNKINFNIVAPMASADGYGYSAEELVRFAVSEHGANIGYVAHDWQDRRYTGDDVANLEIPLGELTSKELLLIYFLPYAFHHFKSDFNVGMTMFETTEIPDTWAMFCSLVKGLIVPSEFCKTAFQNKLPEMQIEAVPLGVNMNTYYMVERAPPKVFTFLMAGLLHYRKGAEFAVRAFKQEFQRTEDVRLILKTRRGFLDVGEESLDDPRIQVVNADYSREDMLSLYHAGDCFLSPSRGEAAGLTPREAMATGLPTIVTNWGGLREISDERYTYPVEVEKLEEAPPVCSSYAEGITCGENIGQFALPSIESLRSQMRYVFEHQEEAKKKGFESAMWVQREFNYVTCSKRWLEAIGEIYDNGTV